MSTLNLGRVQGASIFFSTADSGTNVSKSTLSPSGIVPLVGDSVMFSNGELRKIVTIESTTVACGEVVANFKAEASGTIVKTAAEWESQNPVLGAGVLGYDSTNGIMKLGNGVLKWDYLDIIDTKPKPTFADLDWTEISELSESGYAQSFFSVGDEKTIELTTGEQVTFVILGFDHDDLTSGGKAGITIGMKNLLATTYRMNATATNEGGWDESEMRTSTMATLLSQLPSDLQGVIKQVNKKAMAGSKSTSIITSADKLWLFAKVEVDGTLSNGFVNEGEQYEYWKTVKNGNVDSDRIKFLSNGNGSAEIWWLRSSDIGSNASFSTFNATGGANTIVYARSAQGVSFGFCI